MEASATVEGSINWMREAKRLAAELERANEEKRRLIGIVFKLDAKLAETLNVEMMSG